MALKFDVTQEKLAVEIYAAKQHLVELEEIWADKFIIHGCDTCTHKGSSIPDGTAFLIWCWEKGESSCIMLDDCPVWGVDEKYTTWPLHLHK